MNNIQLHDIKSLETIPDYSLFILIIIVIVSLFILCSTIYYLYQYFKNKNSSKKMAFKLLNELDLSQSKSAAYTITKTGKILISNEREQKLYEELVDNLEQYKYKKDVDKINAQTQQLLKLFLDAVDVK